MTCNDTENACDLIVDLWRSLWNILQRIVIKGRVSHITRDVTACLSRVCNQFIKMPTDQAELHTIMQGFYDIANFPNIVGAIDGITMSQHFRGLYSKVPALVSMQRNLDLRTPNITSLCHVLH
jgi:hypothetical protein